MRSYWATTRINSVRPIKFIRQFDDHTDQRVSYEPTLEGAVLDVAHQLKLQVRGWQDARAQVEALGYAILYAPFPKGK